MYEPIAWEGPLPRHLAIIMDGNGRWARSRGLPRVEGHRRGADTVRTIVRTSRRLGIEALTLYAFSAQNWQRPPREVAALMELLHDYVVQEREEILENDIRFRWIGNLDRLPSFVSDAVRDLAEVSKHNERMSLTLALSYGGREEILRATRHLAGEVAAGRLAPEDIGPECFEDALWTRHLPADVDLLIRTSGEKRVSNFLLWQIAYAELCFSPVNWPDFTADHLFEALRDFGGRDRRFGGVSDEEGG
ncbi:MAG: polyprenyl diphosphate synthase [Myxococcota bacterium]